MSLGVHPALHHSPPERGSPRRCSLRPWSSSGRCPASGQGRLAVGIGVVKEIPVDHVLAVGPGSLGQGLVVHEGLQAVLPPGSGSPGRRPPAHRRPPCPRARFRRPPPGSPPQQGWNLRCLRQCPHPASRASPGFRSRSRRPPQGSRAPRQELCPRCRRQSPHPGSQAVVSTSVPSSLLITTQDWARVIVLSPPKSPLALTPDR